MNEILHMYNGNKQPVEKSLPKIMLVVKSDLDPVVLNHIRENTDLIFIRNQNMGYEVQPETSNQIVRLFLTYNLKTYYHDNNDTQNTMFVAFYNIINQPVWDILK